MMAICLLSFIFTLNSPSYLSSALRNTLGVVINPVNAAFSATGRWIGDRVEFLLDMNAHYDRVKELEAENRYLRLENTRLKEAQSQNEKYTELLELADEYSDYPTVGAKIISKDPTAWHEAYKINKGQKDGIKANMVALAPGGLLGIVRECNYYDSIVISLIDDRSSIAAKCSRTGDTGFVKGNYELMTDGLCRMEIIDIDAQILPGDEIVTSPLSAYYPPGLIIGRVKEIFLDSNSLTKHAIIEPSVSLAHLENLLIITKEISE